MKKLLNDRMTDRTKTICPPPPFLDIGDIKTISTLTNLLLTSVSKRFQNDVYQYSFHLRENEYLKEKNKSM